MAVVAVVGNCVFPAFVTRRWTRGTLYSSFVPTSKANAPPEDRRWWLTCSDRVADLEVVLAPKRTSLSGEAHRKG